MKSVTVEAADPGKDYANVNARLVAEHPSENRADLLAEHERSVRGLADFLRTLTGEQQSGRTGVVFEGEELIIRQNVDLLIEDHQRHSQQIREPGQRG
jgi:hypothetical protein